MDHINARQVPAMVAAHSDYIVNPTSVLYMTQLAGVKLAQQAAEATGKNPSAFLDPEPIPETAMDILTERRRFAATDGSLYHVTEPMLQLAMVAASKLDDEIGTGRFEWSLESLPAMRGVMVFERPVYYELYPGRVASISMVEWFRAITGTSWNTVMVVNGRTTDPNDFFLRRLRANKNGMLSKLGPWAVVDTLTIPDGQAPRQYRLPFAEEAEQGAAVKARQDADEELALQDMALTIDAPERLWKVGSLPGDDETLARIADDPLHEHGYISSSTLVYAIFQLMEQTIVDRTQEVDTRMVRMNRKRTQKHPAMVTVLHLRNVTHYGERDPETGHFLLYRSMTRGHWRNQPYADGTIKRIWIAPFIRGRNLPEAPFTTAKVTTLSR